MKRWGSSRWKKLRKMVAVGNELVLLGVGFVLDIDRPMFRNRRSLWLDLDG